MSTPYFQIKMAGRIIRIEPLTPFLKQFCKDYLMEDGNESDSGSDFSVSISKKDLEYERELSRKIEFPSVEPTDTFLELGALHRKITEGLLSFDTVLIHASCLALDGIGICFTAPSGVGKSTHARLWRERFGERITMINDDKPFLKVADNGVTAYGSPWNGAYHLGENISVPLKEICLFHRDEGNHIKPVSAEDAYPYLLGQIYRPKEEKSLQKLLPLVDLLARKVRIFDVGCNMEPEAAQVVSKMILQERETSDKMN